MSISGFPALSSIYHKHRYSENPEIHQNDKNESPNNNDTVQKPQTRPTDENMVNKPGASDKPTNTSSLPDKVFADIQDIAKQDAKKGDYMSSDRYAAYLKKYKTQNHISPDRGQLMTMFNPMVMNTPGASSAPTFINKIPGFPSYSAKFTPSSVMGGKMSIYDGDGNEILSYNPPPKGGWKEIPTKAETDFEKEADKIYREAYEAARKEQAGKKSAPVTEFNASV